MRREVKTMRRRPPEKILGCMIAAVGVLIILALILPGAFWWFVLGALLIAFGVCLSTR